MEFSFEEASSRFLLSKPVVYLYKTKYVQVYTARDSTNELEVAIKEYICSAKDAPSYFSECKNQSKVQHPYVNKSIGYYHKVDSDQEIVGIITELRKGDWEGEIRRRREAGDPFTDEELIESLRMTSSALECCQLKSIAHRDVKPSNVFATENGKLMLGDFGSSREIVDDETLSIRGTANYLSPILRRNLAASYSLRYDPYKSDVYSLGISIIQAAELLQCKDLYEFCTLDNLQELISSRIAKLRYSDALKDVLRAMLSVEEEERPDCIELAKMVRQQWPTGKCIDCGERAVGKACICTRPPTMICAECSSRHQGGSHDLLMVAESELFDSEQKVTEGKQALRFLDNIFKELHAQERTAIAATKSLDAYFDSFINEINNERSKALKMISELISGISSLYTSLLYLRSFRVIREKALIDRLVSHLPLYINLQMAEPAIQSVQVTENVSTLMQVWKNDYMKVIPLLGNLRVRLQPPKHNSQWIDKPLSREICVTEETSLALINSYRLFVCGSHSNPSQALVVCLSSGNVTVFPNLIHPRFNASVVAVSNLVYIFGGFHLTAAETCDVSSITAKEIAPSTYKHFKCSPCLYDGRIYLPGTQVEVYSISHNNYTTLSSLYEGWRHMMSVVHNDCLYVFTDKELYFWRLKSGQGWNVKKLLSVTCYSQLSLQVINEKVYFIENEKVLEVDMRNFTRFRLTT